jgi:hypothetical protein
VTLFVRSTRSLRLTQEGELFLEHCRPALAGLRQVRDQLFAALKVEQGKYPQWKWNETSIETKDGGRERITQGSVRTIRSLVPSF